MEEPHLYQWVYIENLANFRVKDAERAAFSQALRASLGEQARRWEAEGVDDTEHPLGHYLTGVSDADRARLVSNQDSLFTFATEHFQPLFQIADVVEAELVKLGR